MTDTPEKQDPTPTDPAVPANPADASQPSPDAAGTTSDQEGAAPPAPPAPAPGPGGHDPGDMKEAPLLEHLSELRIRLVRCLIAVGVGFAVCYAFAERLLSVLLKPLTDVLPHGHSLIATSLPETFFTVMKLALVCGAFLVSPYIFYQLWKFVAPGLYKEERRIIVPVAVATAVCFVGGALFGYFIVFPFGFKFFVDYAADYITVMPTISAYFSLAVTLLIAFGLIFELPVFIFFLTSLGLVTTKALRKFRRWAILLCFIVAAILTPTPDAVNQLLMAGPMCILYEVGIWVSCFVDRSRKEEKARRKQAENTDGAADGATDPAAEPAADGAAEPAADGAEAAKPDQDASKAG